jgi:hypothetical protein
MCDPPSGGRHKKDAASRNIPGASMRIPVRPAFWLAAIYAGSACSSTSENSAPDRPLILVATVVDSAGIPVPGSFVSARAYPAATDSIAVDLLQRSDTTGRFVVPLGSFSSGGVDSLRVSAFPRGCDNSMTQALIGDELPEAEGDTLRLTIVLPRKPVPAASAVGQYCGFSVAPDWFNQPDFHLYLRVDSVSNGRLVGRFRMNYNWTQGDDYGSFEGVEANNLLVLELPTDQVWGTCTGFRLVATTADDGAWNSLESVMPQGCAPQTMRFDMAVAEKTIRWP